MKMFSECVGKCYMCRLGDGGCLAGHGDDDFYPATKAQVIRRLDEGRYEDCTWKMKAYLILNYEYDYDKEKIHK